VSALCNYLPIVGLVRMGIGTRVYTGFKMVRVGLVVLPQLFSNVVYAFIDIAGIVVSAFH